MTPIKCLDYKMFSICKKIYNKISKLQFFYGRKTPEKWTETQTKQGWLGLRNIKTDYKRQT